MYLLFNNSKLSIPEQKKTNIGNVRQLLEEAVRACLIFSLLDVKINIVKVFTFHIVANKVFLHCT